MGVYKNLIEHFLFRGKALGETLDTLPAATYNVMSYDGARNCLYICNVDASRVEKYDLSTNTRTASFISRQNLLFVSFLPETDEIVCGLNALNAQVQVYDAATGGFKRAFGAADYAGHCVYDSGRYFVCTKGSSGSDTMLRVYDAAGALLKSYAYNRVRIGRGLSKAGATLYLSGATLLEAGALDFLPLSDPLPATLSTTNITSDPLYEVNVSGRGYYILTRSGTAPEARYVRIHNPDLTLYEELIADDYTTALALGGQTVYALSRTGKLYKITANYL